MGKVKSVRDRAEAKAVDMGIDGVRTMSNKRLARAVGILPDNYSNIGNARAKTMLRAWVLGQKIPTPESLGGVVSVERKQKPVYTIAKKKPAAVKPISTKKEYSPSLHVNTIIGDAFLSTYEWRRVRMEALKKYGVRCQCCGATPDDGVRMHVDHIKPRRIFPELALDVNNLQVLCEECNHGKGNWDMTDWRADPVKHLKSIMEE